MVARFSLAPDRDNYCVVGNPIAHSRSPWIHTAFARQTGENIAFSAVLVEQGDLGATLEAFRAAGMRGLSVTLPFKEEAFRLAARPSELARQAGAANALWLDRQGQWCADNTDGVGLVRDLQTNHGVTLAGRRVLVLGAGGSARGILGPLLAAGPLLVHVANRGLARAGELVARFAPAPVTASGYDALPAGPFDLVVNATAASLQGVLPPLPSGLVAAHTVCYDLMYAARPTVFMTWAMEQGADSALDGLGMLVEQAAEAFWLWRRVRPRTGEVIAALREVLRGS